MNNWAKTKAEKYMAKVGISGNVVSAELIETEWESAYIALTVEVVRCGRKFHDMYSLDLTPKKSLIRRHYENAMGLPA